MIKKNDKRLLKISKRFETALSIILLILVLLGMMDLIRSVYQAYIVDFANPVEYTQLNGFLAEALLLVIGVELVVMLSLHIPGVLLEVLLYAIARKLILLPKSSGMGDLLLGILAQISGSEFILGTFLFGAVIKTAMVYRHHRGFKPHYDNYYRD